MGSRREVWLVIGLVVLMCAIAYVAAPDDTDAGNLDVRPSTFRTADPGAYALYHTVEALGMRVEQRLSDWVEGPPLDGTLVMLAPSQELTPFEVLELREWVEEGGALIFVAGPFAQPDLLEALGLSLERPLGLPESAVPDLAHEWGMELGGVNGFGREFDDESAAFETPGSRAILQTRNPQRSVVVTLPLGAGTVVAWSDATPLTNVNIRDSGAAVVFARAVRELTPPGAAVVFDEYHHGYREGIGTLRATLQFLGRTRPGWMSLQLVAAALGLLWLYGRRFGAPHQPPPARRRSPLEHVEALAGAYQRGGARLTARGLVIAGLARRLGVPVPQAGTEEEWLDRLARRSAAARQHAEALRGEWQRGTNADLVAMARHADAIVVERS